MEPIIHAQISQVFFFPLFSNLQWKWGLFVVVFGERGPFYFLLAFSLLENILILYFTSHFNAFSSFFFFEIIHRLDKTSMYLSWLIFKSGLPKTQVF